MLNPFFLQGSKTEQSLIQDLINEQLRMYGVEVYYIPRKYLTEKKVLREVIESAFSDAYPLEAYIENYDGYGDNTVLLSKFGIQALNELTTAQFWILEERKDLMPYLYPIMSNGGNS